MIDWLSIKTVLILLVILPVNIFAIDSVYPEQVKPCLEAMAHIHGLKDFDVIGASEQGEDCIVIITFRNEIQLKKYIANRKEQGLLPYQVVFSTKSNGKLKIVEIQVHVSN